MHDLILKIKGRTTIRSDHTCVSHTSLTDLAESQKGTGHALSSFSGSQLGLGSLPSPLSLNLETMLCPGDRSLKQDSLRRPDQPKVAVSGEKQRKEAESGQRPEEAATEDCSAWCSGVP